MKKILFLLGALVVMQTMFLMAGQDDLVWMIKTQDIYHLEFMSNSNIFLAHGKQGGNDSRKGIIIFNTKGDTLKQIYTSEGLQSRDGQGMWDAHFSRDNRYLVVIWEYEKDKMSSGMLEIFETENWKSVKKIEIPGDSFSLLAAKVLISPDNRTVVGITQDGFYFYNFEDGKFLKEVFDFGDNSNAYSVYSLYSQDGKYIYFTGSDGKLRFLNTESFKVDYTYDAGYNKLSMNKDGNMIAFKTGLSGQAVQIMNPETKEIIRTIPGSATGVTGLAFSPDNKNLAVTYENSSLMKIWDIQTGKDLVFSPGSFGSVAFSTDNQYIVSNIGDYLFL